MSRSLRNMTDVEGARRLLLFWVPKWASRWKVTPWGFTMGRFWVQWTPPGKWNKSQPLDRTGSLYQDALKALYSHDPIEGERIRRYVNDLEELCGVQHR
jgi:hypothetical protein